MSGNLKAKDRDGTFDGQVTLSDDQTRLSLSGVLTLYDPMNLNLTLTCTEKWGRSLITQ
ncbi:MAG: hypothetical protein J7501_16765 [Bdellovibrio sp.]|nr:hypothetical protein [Bdellovibrio sp.]